MKEYAIGTLRVSSTKQGLQGDSTDQQQEQIQRRVTQLSQIQGTEIIIEKWFEFTESASSEFDMQPLQKLLEYCKTKNTDRHNHHKIKYAFFKSIDRGTRGGATIYGLLKAQFAKYGVQMIDVYGVIGTQEVNTLEHLGIEYGWSKFNPTWITELLEAERGKGEVRDILTRMIGAEVRYVRLGYRVRPAPPGYQNTKIETPYGKRVILTPHAIESPWYVRMFELREQGNLTDKEIVDEVNKKGFKSRRFQKHDVQDKTKIVGYGGEESLTVKQLQATIKNPIYAGVNTEKWTDGKPIKARFDGLVSIERFNKANRGKVTIVEEGDIVRIFNGEAPLRQQRKLKENPLYPYKRQILCPYCRKPLSASASRGKLGKYHPAYHCSRGHKYFRVRASDMHDFVDTFVNSVHFSEDFRKKFTQIVLEEWEKRKNMAKDDSISSEQKVLELKQESKMITDKIPMLSSEIAIKAMEEKLEKLDFQIAQAVQLRNKKENDVNDIQTVINYTNYFMEHLEDLILGGTDSLKNAALFGLIFEETPTYTELVNGTPKLSCLFALNEEFKKTKSLSVSRLGIEPRTYSLRGSCSNQLS